MYPSACRTLDHLLSPNPTSPAPLSLRRSVFPCSVKLRNSAIFSYGLSGKVGRQRGSQFSDCLGTRRRRGTHFSLLCSAVDQQGEGKRPSFLSWLPIGREGPEGLLRIIAGATSSPICQFIDSPTTFLHSVDPKIKLVWLLALVIIPARSNIFMRLGIVLYLSITTVNILPARIWMDQLARVSFLSGILFLMLAFGTDSAPPLVQIRSPPSTIAGLPDIPSSLGGYSYLILKLGPLQLTRKGLSVAGMSSCLSFTILQSASLCLATTTPEQLAAALRWYMHPLMRIGVPVNEIILTLLLSLRFINLVFDEVHNAALGIIARRIQWKQLTPMETIDVFLTYIRRIFKNIFSHAEQITQAMIVRGFRGESEKHTIYMFPNKSYKMADVISLACLGALIATAILCERLLI